MKKFKYYILHSNSSSSKKICDYLLTTLKNNEFSKEKFEYLFIIGGDGFFLSSLKPFLNSYIKVIFINAGTLGFYASINDIKKLKVDQIINNKNYHELNLLNVKIDKKQYYCINDFSFHNNHTTDIEIKINNKYLEKLFGNGFLVATNYGSTGRNKSLNGPIIFPDVNAMVFSEVESIQNKFNTSLMSPLVLNSKTLIEADIINRNKSNGWFLIDGKEVINNNKKICIKISMSKSKAKIMLCSSIEDYINKLQYAFIDKGNDNGKRKND